MKHSVKQRRFFSRFPPVGRLKSACILLVAASLLTVSGCKGTIGIYSNFRELERIELVRTLGVDNRENGVLITVSTGGGMEGTPPVIYTKEGATLSTAVETLEKNSMKNDAVFSHTEHVVIGEETAAKGIGGFLDYIARAMKIRLDTNIFIVRGGTSEELITSVADKETGAADFLSALKLDVPYLGEGYVLTCGEAASNLSKNGCTLVQAVELRASDEWSKDEEKKKISSAGYAVVKDGRLIDYVPLEECAAVGIITGSVNNKLYSLSYDGVPVSLLLVSSKTEIRPDFSGEHLAAKISVKLALNVEQSELPADISIKSIREKLTGAVSEEVRRSVSETVQRSIELGADYLGIGEEMYRKSPEKMAALNDTWQEVFSELTFSVTVESELERTYDLRKPAQFSGEGA